MKRTAASDRNPVAWRRTEFERTAGLPAAQSIAPLAFAGCAHPCPVIPFEQPAPSIEHE